MSSGVQRPRRVAMLVDSLLAGGAERIAVETASALDRSRFEAFVLVTRGRGPLEATLDAAGVPWSTLDRRRGFSPRKLAAAHRALAEADVIFAHKFGSNLWGALFARSTGVPLVAREPTFSGVRTRRRTYGYRWWIAPAAARIVCPSDVVRDSLTREGVRPELLRVIPNGVRLDAALPRAEARRELDLPPERFVVGIVARLREEKAHHVLLRAAAALVREGRELTVCVVGDGPCRSALERLAHELDLGEALSWAGERRDAKRLVRAFDVGVICSDWEGLPVAALEVMAGGTPLVATDVGILSTVVGGGAGTIVPIGDHAALARALATLQDAPALRAEMGEAARERIRNAYGFERMVREFEAVLDEALVGNGAAPDRRRRRAQR